MCPTDKNKYSNNLHFKKGNKMATIVSTLRTKYAAYTVNSTTMTASDTLTYVSGNDQELEVTNTTGSPIVLTIAGSGATTITPSGYGGSISVAAGKAFTIAANATQNIPLDGHSAFLAGTISLTGGTGLVARLINK
jgi:hypothetical protein